MYQYGPPSSSNLSLFQPQNYGSNTNWFVPQQPQQQQQQPQMGLGDMYSNASNANDIYSMFNGGQGFMPSATNNPVTGQMSLFGRDGLFGQFGPFGSGGQSGLEAGFGGDPLSSMGSSMQTGPLDYGMGWSGGYGPEMGGMGGDIFGSGMEFGGSGLSGGFGGGGSLAGLEAGTSGTGFGVGGAAKGGAGAGGGSAAGGLGAGGMASGFGALLAIPLIAWLDQQKQDKQADALNAHYRTPQGQAEMASMAALQQASNEQLARDLEAQNMRNYGTPTAPEPNYNW